MVFKFTLGVLLLSSFLLEGSVGSICSTVEIKGRNKGRHPYGAQMTSDDDLLLPKCPSVDDIDDADIPDEFDARKNWPKCEDILWSIGDQGYCSSCWAFGITEVMSDRLCIASNGKRRVKVSAQDLLSCGKGSAAWIGDEDLQGCKGGNVAKGWNFTAKRGVVSSTCVPYDYTQIQKCSANYDNCGGSDNNVSLVCSSKCDAASGLDYTKDLIFPENPCMLPRGDVKAIQKEIMKNGPVVAVMKLSQKYFMDYMQLPNFEDVLDLDFGDFGPMNHAVKLMGWGVKMETCGKIVPYWLVANSFGTGWQSQGGFFKVYRRTEGEDREVANLRGSCIDHSVTTAFFTKYA